MERSYSFVSGGYSFPAYVPPALLQDESHSASDAVASAASSVFQSAEVNQYDGRLLQPNINASVIDSSLPPSNIPMAASSNVMPSRNQPSNALDGLITPRQLDTWIQDRYLGDAEAIAIAQNLLIAGRPEDAVGFLKAYLLYFPGSAGVWNALDEILYTPSTGHTLSSPLPSSDYSSLNSYEQISDHAAHELIDIPIPSTEEGANEQIHALQNTIENERYNFINWKQAAERDLLIKAEENHKLKADCEAFLAQQQMEFIKLQKSILDVLEASNQSSRVPTGQTG